MRQVAAKGLLTMVATGGVIAAGGGLAHADAGSAGTAADSPGVLSGNTVQVPVHVPVNACGNTVNVVGALNPAIGNRCANVSGPGARSGSTAGPRGGSGATGGSSHSPGVGSGNTVQVPVHVPVNACGNTVNVVGALNPAIGNKCSEMVVPPTHPAPPTKPCPPTTPGHPAHPGGGTPGGSGNPGGSGHPATAGSPAAPRAATPSTGHSAVTPAAGTPGTGTETLAHTGAGGVGLLAPASGALLLGGTVLYRRGRRSAR
jgi:hypothetical protein